MAARLPDGNMEALQQFVSQSLWDWTPVCRRIAERLCQVIRTEVRVVDDVSLPKCGKASGQSAWPGSTAARWANRPTARSR
ncbi:transposase [Streptomyces silvensis]|nr:transposase [Streptomyces silvensis]